MGWRRKELNLGQLVRQQHGTDASLIGCLSHTGTVAAAYEWDEDMQVRPVNPSMRDSYEYLMHQTGIPSFMLDLRKGHGAEELRKELMKKRSERFIGVIYRADTERMSHYMDVCLPEQFDALIWFDESKAVQPLEKKQPHTSKYFEESYPFGL